ncbi:hypothetical protein F5882DRAFT_437086 [Hyaloscypha sp. PMI_1271]|nr:hypothetical protein F5882DRAFT_437086 [Hyaloscypha sp. PMI_1271]
MSEEAAALHTETEDSKPTDEHNQKSKRDSAVIIASDPETSSIETAEVTASEGSSAADEEDSALEEGDGVENDQKEGPKDGDENKEQVVVGEKGDGDGDGELDVVKGDETEKVEAPKELVAENEGEVISKQEVHDAAEEAAPVEPIPTDSEHKPEESAQLLSVSEPSKEGEGEEDEVDDDSISTTVETGEPIIDVPLKQSLEVEGGGAGTEEQSEEIKDSAESTIAEGGGSTDAVTEKEEPATIEPEAQGEQPEEVDEVEEKEIGETAPVEAETPPEITEEQTEETLDPSVVGGGEESKEISPEAKDPAGNEPDPTSEAAAEEPSKDEEKNPEPLVDTNPSGPEVAITSLPQGPQPITQKAAPSPLQISRSKFRQALNMLIQLLSEAEDDDGVVHLNLNDKESELRKVVRMLGKRLDLFEEVEREVEWVGLVGTFDERREKEG